MTTLGDLGERWIIKNLIENWFPLGEKVKVPIGDDAAAVEINGYDNLIVISTDPTPVPVA